MVTDWRLFSLLAVVSERLACPLTFLEPIDLVKDVFDDLFDLRLAELRPVKGMQRDRKTGGKGGQTREQQNGVQPVSFIGLGASANVCGQQGDISEPWSP